MQFPTVEFAASILLTGAKLSKVLRVVLIFLATFAILGVAGFIIELTAGAHHPALRPIIITAKITGIALSVSSVTYAIQTIRFQLK